MKMVFMTRWHIRFTGSNNIEMKNTISIVTVAVMMILIIACSSPSNERAISLDKLEEVQDADEKEAKAFTATRDIMTAKELIALAECKDIACVEYYMKNLSPDFFYAHKGQYAAQHRSAITDTAGNEIVIPLSTFYVDVNPQASWRAAHTIHKKEAADQLLTEFVQLGFQLADSGYFSGITGRQRYISEKYPGKSLYMSVTFQPWYFKGLYENKVTWPCYVFEVYNDK